MLKNVLKNIEKNKTAFWVKRVKGKLMSYEFIKDGKRNSYWAHRPRRIYLKAVEV